MNQSAERPKQWRSLVLPLASIGYVIALALWVDRALQPQGWLAGVAAASIAVVGTRQGSLAGRLMGWGLAAVVASLAARSESRALDAIGAVAAMVCAIGASFALAHVPQQGGLVRHEATSPWPRAVVLAAVWGPALVAYGLPHDPSTNWPSTGWLAQHSGEWALAAAVATALVFLWAIGRALLRRRLELGVAERLVAMRLLLGACCVASLVVCTISEASFYSTARLFVALASVAIGYAAMAADAARVAGATRRLVVLGMVGGAVALLGGAAALGSGSGWGAWEVTVGTAAAALFVGAAAPRLEAPFRPSRGVWLDAFARARDNASRAEPDEAIRSVLDALRGPAGPSSASPELWTFHPVCVATVDAAGYLHASEDDLPDGFAAVVAAEPLSTLRIEVLDALEVRRPDLRPLAKWMSDRGALLVTLVESDGASDGGTEGMLVLRRAAGGAAARSLTFEEVRSLKAAADGLAAACRARASQARMMARAQEAVKRCEATEERLEALRHESAEHASRHGLAAMRLAWPAAVGAYSAASRMALETLERQTALGAPIAVVAPSGVDPIPYLARAHLSGARRAGPLVVVDGASTVEHALERWGDPRTSPLALANGGMLVLLDGAALPARVQQLLASAFAEKRVPWERPTALDVQLAWTGVATPDDLVAQARLEASLATRLGDARQRPTLLPRLRERSDDLRAILTDRFAREGLRVLGRPVGIEQTAYARLVDYRFPGEDAELASIVQRLVARCTGDLVRAADVEALRLRSEPTGERRKDPLSA